MKSVII